MLLLNYFIVNKRGGLDMASQIGGHGIPASSAGEGGFKFEVPCGIISIFITDLTPLIAGLNLCL